MKRITGLLVLFFGFQAQAGFMVEPFVGYDMGASKTTSTAGVDGSSTTTGMGYGALLGYRFSNGVSVAAEYAGGTGKSKDTTAGSTAPDSDYARTAIGAVVGYDRGMWRIYGGYGFSDSNVVKANGSTTTEDNTFTGTNYKIGVGIMPIRHFAVNLQYTVPTYTKMKNNTLTAAAASEKISDYFSKFETSVTTLTLSFPFDFGGK